jgi:hypothetical protein
MWGHMLARAIFGLPWHFHGRIHPMATVKEAPGDQEASSNQRHQEQPCEHIEHLHVSFYLGKVTLLLRCFRAFAAFPMHSLAGEAETSLKQA